MPRLVRRRVLPVPTALGAALLVALGLAACGALLAAAPGLYGFLAPQEPLGRGLLVVEGWIGRDALAAAAEAWREGEYEALLTTGGPVESAWRDFPFESHAELAAHALRGLGVPRERVTAVPSPASAQDRTFLSAVEVRRWIAAQGRSLDAVDVFSEGPHARRSRRLYRLALGPEVAVGVRTAPPRAYEPARWWATSAGAKSVLTEAIGLAWVTCCFDPGEPGSRRERWGR